MSFQAYMSDIFFPAGNQSYGLPARIHVLEGVKKNEFGISRGYISIILIYFEGSHENVENVRKSKKIRINFWKMWIWEILKIVFCWFFRSYGPASSDLCVLGVVGTQQTAKRKCSYAFLNFHIFEIYSIFLGFPYIFNIFVKSFDMYQNYRYVHARDAKFVFFTSSRTCIRVGSP